jgi:flagellar basal-body rod modification protein FlgD
MDVAGTTSTNTQQTNTQQTNTSTGTSTLGYDAFLKLLTAQMQYQDPTKPMDSTQFVSQLASFSNVEQSVKMNSKLDALITSTALNQADGLIGKTVTSADEKITGKVASVRIFSDGVQAILENGTAVLMEAGVKITAS